MAPSVIIISILIAGAYANHFIDFIHTQANLILQDSKADYCPFTDGSITRDRNRLFIQLDQVLLFKSQFTSHPSVKQMAKLHSKSWNDVVKQIRILDDHLKPKSAGSDGVLDEQRGDSNDSALSSMMTLLELYDRNVDLAVHCLAVLLTRFPTNPEEFLDISDFPEDDDDVNRPFSILPYLLFLESRHYIKSHSDYYQQQFKDFYSDFNVPQLKSLGSDKARTKQDLVQAILGDTRLRIIELPVLLSGTVTNMVVEWVEKRRSDYGISSHTTVNLLAYLSGLSTAEKKCLGSGSCSSEQGTLSSASTFPRSPSLASLSSSKVNVKMRSLASEPNLNYKAPRSPRLPLSPQSQHQKKACRKTAHSYESLEDLVNLSQPEANTVN